jgi:hypothetical protein
MRCDATDYVGETLGAVKALLEREFAGAAVYAGDMDRVPAFGGGGAFCLEAAASGVETAAADYGRVVVTLRIWTFAGERGGERAEEAVPALAQKLEAVLLAAARDPAYPGWVRTEYLQTNYVTRRAGRPFRLKYIPAGRTEWRVCLAARR